MIKRKTSVCLGCNKERQIYAKKLCGFCYDRQRKRSPLKKSTKPIAKRSDKGKIEDRIYYPKARKFKEANPYCKAKLDGCTYMTTEVHHMRGRGVMLNVEKFWLPVCRNCHDIITPNSDLARKLGLSISRLNNQI